MLRQLLDCSVAALLVAVGASAALAQQPGVNWRTNLDQAKLEAAQSKRLLLVHFTTRTCGPCKVLDQNVFSQPQVSAAIEQDYVPVRIDADASPALAAMFRIDRVPTEFIMTPEGNVLVSPPIPDKADAYVSQIQNLARHFKQAAGPTATPAATVNPAYASLPVGPNAPGAQAAGQAPATNNIAAQQPSPQAQSNPFVNQPGNNRYGQAQSVYSPTPQTQPAQQAPQGAAQPATPQVAAGATAPAPQNPVMPANAMPRGYRNEAAGAAAGAGAAAATPAANGAAVGGGAPTTAAATAPAAVAAASAQVSLPMKPKAPQLPAGSPPLAFDGYCPVTLKTLNCWTPGDAQFGAVHRGRTYLFAGAEQRDQFLANPDAYSPVFAGLDPVLLIEKQQAVDGTRALGFRYGDAFYLFSSEETKQKFKDAPHTYAAGVRQAMNRIDAGNGGTIRR